MKKLLFCLLSLSFITATCADRDEQPAAPSELSGCSYDPNAADQLNNDFLSLVADLVSQSEIPSVADLITALLNMGFDQDSPGIEMLEDIQHDTEQDQVNRMLTASEVTSFKLQFLQKIMSLYTKIDFITNKTDFSKETKAKLIKDEVQEWLDYCFPGLKLPEGLEFFELKEFLLLNKSVAVPDYKARIYALIDVVRSLNPDLSSIGA